VLDRMGCRREGRGGGEADADEHAIHGASDPYAPGR